MLAKILSVLLIYWLGYSVAVVIYLNILSRKYLRPVHRDHLIMDKSLKNYEKVIDELKDRNDINILVLSGGGVRGAVPLYVLAEIERLTNRKIGELFDFVSGTSTGAISVATFAVDDGNGGYKYSAKYLLDHYYQNSRMMLKTSWLHLYLSCFGLFAPRCLPKNKMLVLEEYFANLTIGELRGNILIPVYNIDQNQLLIVKNWHSPNKSDEANFLVKDLINGASNPPVLFPPLSFAIKKRYYMFIDPAVIINNPVLHVLIYVRTMFPNKHINVVVVGNGGASDAKYNYRNMFSFGLYGLYQYLFSAPSLSSKLAINFIEKVLLEAKQFDRNFNFYRINAISKVRLSPTSLSTKNIEAIASFGQRMVQINRHKIHNIAKVLLKDRWFCESLDK